MLQPKVFADTREYCRFKALDGTYVLLKMQRGESYGFLTDFSSGGLSFEYIPTGEPIEKNCRIDIIMDQKQIHVEIPSCRKVFEFELEDEYYSPVKMHRVGVQFNGIDPHKLNDLVPLICPKRNLI